MSEGLERLRRLVQGIFPCDDAVEGDLGIWIQHSMTLQDHASWDYRIGDAPGKTKLVELDPSTGPAVIAHEFEHACTRMEDLDRRGEVDTDEWRSELTADWHADKWGLAARFLVYERLPMCVIMALHEVKRLKNSIR